MSGMKEQVRAGVKGAGPAGLKNFALALELLRGCGMILRAKLLRTSPADGRCHRAERDTKGPLISKVHPGLVIWCNGLNLSRGSCV